MFIDNKYKKIYDLMIARAKSRIVSSVEYYEEHHIVPKSLGGENYEKSNLVLLTAKEHFIAHRLLVKFTHSVAKRKMSYALWYMTISKSYKITSRSYEYIRISHAEEVRKHKLGKKRKPFSAQARKNMSLAAKNRVKRALSDKQKAHLKKLNTRDRSGIKNPFYNKRHSSEALRKIGEASRSRMIGRPKQKKACEHCGGKFAPNMLKRYHSDNCNKKP